MLTAAAPDRAGLVDLASGLFPTPAGGAERPPSGDTVARLADAGILRLLTPRRHGGHGSDATTLVEVAAGLARGDGAAAWVTSAYWVSTWISCMFPEPVQDEVFADPDARVCGTLSPTATAVATDGGVVLDGRAASVTGARHARWQAVVAIRSGPGADPFPIVALVPAADLRILDGPDASGTGAADTVAEGLFVASERVLPLPQVLRGEPVSRTGAAIHRAPLLPVAAASVMGVLTGLGAAARDAAARDGRGTGPARSRVAGAARKVDEAARLTRRLASDLDHRAAEALPWGCGHRAEVRDHLGLVVALTRDAVDVFAAAGGDPRTGPLARIARDVTAVDGHALVRPGTGAELYSRVLCGLYI